VLAEAFSSIVGPGDALWLAAALECMEGDSIALDCLPQVISHINTELSQVSRE
jgi:hypothetical protein